MFKNLLLVIIGGGCGSACRYLFSLLSGRWFGAEFAWGTLGVNWGGCLVIGLLFALVEKSVISPAARLFIMTGFLGGLTTFSTFALESVNFMRSGETMAAITNIAINNGGGLLLVIVGIWLGRLI